MNKQKLKIKFAFAAVSRTAPRCVIAAALSYKFPEASEFIWAALSLDGGMAVQRAIDAIRMEALQNPPPIIEGL